eukprot:6629017-Prymnesium_polylepis.1
MCGASRVWARTKDRVGRECVQPCSVRACGSSSSRACAGKRHGCVHDKLIDCSRAVILDLRLSLDQYTLWRCAPFAPGRLAASLE